MSIASSVTVNTVNAATAFDNIKLVVPDAVKIVRFSEQTVRVYRGIENEPLDLPGSYIDWEGESQFPGPWQDAMWPQDAAAEPVEARFRESDSCEWRYGKLVGREPGGKWFGAGIGWAFYTQCQVKRG